MKEKPKDKVYAYLCQNPHPSTVSRIADKLGMPRSTVTHALTALRNERKVERELGLAGLGNLWYV